MDTIWLIKNVEKTYTIIDFITVIYCYLSHLDITSLNGKYNKFFKNEHIRNIYSRLDIAFEVAFFEDDSNNPSLSNSFINEWISIISSNTEIMDLICFETLNLFDKYYLDVEFNLEQILSRQGPLNICLSSEFAFFNKPPKRYNSNILEKNRIRIGRQTTIADTHSLSNEFKKFEIIPNNQMFDYKTIIKKDNTNLATSNRFLGIVPADVYNFINVEHLFSEKLININYNNEYENDFLQKLFSTLVIMDKDGINIAIFPELFLFPNTIERISKFCIENNFINLKLIFIGSKWSNRENKSFLLSSKGTKILSHTKKMPFDYYIDSEKYTENITKNNIVNLVDIDGLGRIGYFICKDVLSENLNHLYTSIFSTNIVFVSACTSQTSAMVNKAKADASTKAVSTIMCNAYSLVELDKIDINNILCYICVPEIKEKRIDSFITLRNKEKEWLVEKQGYFNYFKFPLE